MKNKLKKSLLLIFILLIISIVNSSKVEATTVNNIVFNSKFYAEQNIDLMNAFGYNEQALLNHFTNYGMAEGRQASMLFDVNFYKGMYFDLQQAYGGNNQAYYNHFTNWGINEGRIGSIIFDVNYYKNTYADLKQAYGENNQAYYIHFINYGMSEGRTGSMFLDVNFYKSKYGDLSQAYGNNNKAYYEHFVKYGMAEGRQASASFDVKYYLSQYGDLQKAYGSNYKEATKHYIYYGKNEGRKCVNKEFLNGYEVMGNIEIPKTNVNLPILSEVTVKSLETSVAILYGVGLNQVGNTTICGHNYRDGTFFSNNKNLSNGDIIHITDQTGTKITYQIYDIFETTPSDADYMIRDTKGKREISLTTTAENSSNRLIILAQELTINNGGNGNTNTEYTPTPDEYGRKYIPQKELAKYIAKVPITTENWQDYMELEDYETVSKNDFGDILSISKNTRLKLKNDNIYTTGVLEFEITNPDLMNPYADVTKSILKFDGYSITSTDNFFVSKEQDQDTNILDYRITINDIKCVRTTGNVYIFNIPDSFWSVEKGYKYLYIENQNERYLYDRNFWVGQLGRHIENGTLKDINL